MKLIKYLLDKIPQIIISIMGFTITIFMLNAFKVESTLKIAITIIFLLFAYLILELIILESINFIKVYQIH